jgi:hypothetical protein
MQQQQQQQSSKFEAKQRLPTINQKMQVNNTGSMFDKNNSRMLGSLQLQADD